MEAREAILLIEGAIPGKGGLWADLGCGDGTFTLALAELLGPAARIYAVDNDSGALSGLRRRVAKHGNVTPVLADFTEPLALPAQEGPLDGLLFANSLHYVSHPESVLARLARTVRPGGRVIFVEYDRRSANAWVPYPISPSRLEAVAAAAGLSPPEIVGTAPSAFKGNLYAAVATWPGAP